MPEKHEGSGDGIKAAAAKANPWGKHWPSWAKHLMTAAIMVATGAVAWNNLERDVGDNHKTGAKNQTQIAEVKEDIKGITRSIGELDKKQSIITHEIKSIRESAETDRGVAKERQQRIEKDLDRILNRLERPPPARRSFEPK